ncbi:uncharacterized protein L3040_004929 [Drepanopeziza brunnea f. sp. 'multigermtubi']|uniref:Plasma membrane G-protein coupled receptor n=1 Tax=Marssonina brunnea f. sp. multigermtubi (strain MB_m1) TaxID=1072389 RepID=K1X9G3_MARBU|nr:plasma membrane G-protein coupled receptor [Drepanopeziza brunnea f. sp. 'multigermtubi' MB_m1]EKD21706.1 plasma membrane G-protein coupled receptor [Drepanopeziza brunnea f. sp. 'multigermtubi' MB_m1]KAJ5042380.1 hypothetical protein L3040_004929 [Drepanopeziza brunnea f. sp. 'multigermtubi']
MAPLSSGVDAMRLGNLVLPARGLGGGVGTISAHAFNAAQKNTLQILAVTFSTISVASSVLTFYWFLKMRRSFRHDLIMLLIQSDMFKALWFMIYPIVVFVNGPVEDTSAFCQANGFLIALGLEASDFSVLMIAVHSALYIFRPKASRGEGGLYPYRKLAYTLWVFFPLMMASLAFINGRHAYVSVGTYCYLPVRPFWYRLALDWIPRYIIFVIILAIYASIYFYVKYRFSGFGRLARYTSHSNGNSSKSVQKAYRRHRHRRQNTVPSTPVLATYDWLKGHSRQSSGSRVETAARKPSVSTEDSYRLQLKGKRSSAHRFMFQSLSGPGNSSPAPPSEGSVIEDDSFEGPTMPQPLPPTLPEPISPRSQSVSEIPSRATSWRDNFVRRFSPHNTSRESTTRNSVVDIFTVLRRHPDQSTDSPHPIISLRRDDAELDRTREKIQRQLRFLFIYPLVYIGMWFLPFASHGLQYSDRFATDPPFALTCCATVSLSLQAAVDAWLFSTREKPWKHIPGTNGGFWVSLKFWADWTGFRKRRVRQSGPGKTRGEAHREAVAARQRLVDERNEAQAGASPRPRGPDARRAEWWDSIPDDGVMNPVRREASDLLENATMSEERFSHGGHKLLLGSGTKRAKEMDELAFDYASCSDPGSPVVAEHPTAKFEYEKAIELVEAGGVPKDESKKRREGR